MDILTKKQKELYDSFYESTHHNEHYDSKTELLIGLSAAIALSCEPCVSFYLKKPNRQIFQKVKYQKPKQR